MTLFKNKYRIESTRLPSWDYGQAGYYYVTICTKNRVHFFGEIVQEDVELSSIGEIVAQEWIKTETIRSNAQLDEWIIMPNHMHMIIIITHKIETPTPAKTPRQVTSGQLLKQTQAASRKWAANTLGSIIGQFKGKCTKRIRAEGYHDFAWQPRFYDRIINSEQALDKARYYILSNPINWEIDHDNLVGLYM